MVKLNRLHWHITDTNSFPLVIESRPFLHQYGSYSPKEVYTSDNVKDVSLLCLRTFGRKELSKEFILRMFLS